MRPEGFVLFGPVHLAILLATPLLGYGLARLGSFRPGWGTRMRIGAGLFLLANEAVWYWYRYSHEGNRFPEGLPLQLCDLTLLMTGLAALTGSAWCFDFAYFAGFGGASMALLTPDLWAPFPSYPSIYYFIAHGGMVATTLAMIWARLARPKSGSLWRAFALVNAFAAIVAGFNLVHGTNYMYLSRKPASATLLDLFGPWPWYLLAGEVFALALFWLMWLPFRPRRTAARPAAEGAAGGAGSD
jgi:hypothetical integral membrane protein (TIGR02206 family)